MRILNIGQQSPEWFKEKAGRASASNFDKILTRDGKPSKSQIKYLYQLAGEKITGIREEGYQNFAMQRGIEMEAEARQYYELLNNVEVQQVGMCISDDELSACSPDGLVGENGGLEIKCPTLPVHVEYLYKGGLVEQYFQQLQGSMFVTGREWWDIISYCPGIKPLVIRITPDKDWHSKLKIELKLFNDRLNQITEKIR